MQSSLAAVQTNIASAGYFELIGVRLLRGRTFTEQDNDHAPPVAVVTQAMATRYWPGQDPVGRRVHFGGAQAKSPWLTVVGVVNDIRTGKLEDPARPTLFRPLRQVSGLSLSIVMQASGDPRSLGIGVGARGTKRRSRSADLWCQVADRSRVDVHGRAPVHDPIARGLRGARAGSRRDRDLRRDGVHRGAAHARDRHPDGARARARSRSSRSCCAMRSR